MATLIKHRSHRRNDRGSSGLVDLGQQHLLMYQQALRLLRCMLAHLVCRLGVWRGQAGGAAGRRTGAPSQHQSGTYQRQRLEKRRIVHVAVLGATSVIS